MRALRVVALLLVLALLGACSGGDDEAREPRPRRTTTTTAGAPTTTTTALPLPQVPPRTFTPTALRSGFAHGYELVRRESPAEVAADLDLMAATGARWLRVSVGWGHIERIPGFYDWEGTDRVVQGARERGLSIVAVITSAPSWDSDPGCRTNECAPDDPAPYAAFARVAAERYAPLGVRHWEIWNEPNHVPFWGPRPDPAKYVELLRGAYTAIHDVDPTATVITGGLSPAPDEGGEIAPLTFLRQVYEHGGRHFFDAVAHHPYQYPELPASAELTNAFRQTELLHDLMASHGDDDKRIWGTEVGAPTRGGRSVSEDEQAGWVREYYRLWNEWSFTGPLLWYSARDHGRHHTIEDSYGLVRHDRRPKPALGAFEDVMESDAPLPRDARIRE